MRLLRFLPLPLLLVVGLLVAGCGSGGGNSARSVPANAVAVVGPDTITKAAFNDLMAGAVRNYKARKTAFPKAGTAQYKTIQDQAISYLVQEDELAQKAKGFSITVTPKDVQAALKQIKAQYFGGSQAKYLAQLKAQGLTEAQVEQDEYAQILSQKLYTKVTAAVTVTPAAIKAYYVAHKSSYNTAASRKVRHILVASKTLADQLETQLKNGASFASLAKKYSKDPGSAKQGGDLTISKGQTVPAFDKVAFSLKTGQTSPPVHSQYGWHIIQALSAITPGKVTKLASVSASIKTQLLQAKKTSVMTAWINGLKKDFAVGYATGYVPAATTTSSTTTATTTG
jgi:parvulin-like peptidyl-prolyl isomerase